MKLLKTIAPTLIGTIVLLVVLEFAANWALRNKGIEMPLFMSTAENIKGLREHAYTAIDPHLGYAHSASQENVKSLVKRNYVWLNGFAIYTDNEKQLERPIILALGGSTTDGVYYGHSWPEELARILKEKKYKGTVVNGGTGGYSTNQELLKLIRDGLEFKPDIVISYSGVNDRGRYGELPYPMVHEYQRRILESLSRKSRPRFLPSTITYLQLALGMNKESTINITYGMESSHRLDEHYRRNIELMHAITRLNGGEFLAFIQPNAFYKSKHNVGLKKPKSEKYISDVRALYKEIVLLPKSLPYVHDATAILESQDNVYQDDGFHIHQQGNKVVAEYIFSVVEPTLGKAGKSAGKTVRVRGAK